MTRSAVIVVSAAFAALCLAVPRGPLWAQDKDVAIEPYRLPLTDKAILAKATALKEAGKLLGVDQVNKGLKSPAPAELKLAPVSTRPLAPREIAARARKSLVRVGWFFLCKRCRRWHLNLAGGYAITADGAVVTCHHCVAAKGLVMREGYLIALDADNDVLPVTAILARDAAMDAAIIRVAGGSLTPLPLNDRVAPGDNAYLYSDPMGVAGYFSTGMVNRFFWRTSRPGNPATLSGARGFRMHVSTDWAPGSSGAPVLDGCGNAVGHVAVIASLQRKTASAQPAPRPATKPAPKDGDDSKDGDGSKDGNGAKDDNHGQAPIAPPAATAAGATMIILHEAVPARAVKLLAQSLANSAKKAK